MLLFYKAFRGAVLLSFEAGFFKFFVKISESLRCPDTTYEVTDDNKQKSDSSSRPLPKCWKYKKSNIQFTV